MQKYLHFWLIPNFVWINVLVISFDKIKFGAASITLQYNKSGTNNMSFEKAERWLGSSIL
jgi:hypothetical protein